MSPDILVSLVNLGAAGAVIAVVWIFTKQIERIEADNRERDKDWQAFFNSLNCANVVDMKRISDSLDQVVIVITTLAKDLRTHDNKVDRRIKEGVEATRQAMNGKD